MGDEATTSYLLGVASSALIYFTYLYDITESKKPSELNGDVQTHVEGEDDSYETGWMTEDDINDEDWVKYDEEIYVDVSNL